MRGSFTRAADKPIEHEALRAANQILSSTLFMMNGQPFSYGNHTFAEAAANAFSKVEAAELACSPNEATSLAGQVVMQYQHHMEIDNTRDYSQMYALWHSMQKRGLTQHVPYALKSRSIA